MLPLIGELVQNTFSQVGEYVDEPAKIAAMIPVLEAHLTHVNPKIRHASLHCIG